ncbi:Crp/Fnr family transcriptional regulator [Emticicia sp. BO119]|uniref:Crp/Fnr family transcriptional regulator n=1 Tax=Emticicia sp. BO119 TaxID=2757768 RepID=UPI0015F01332|nr:Crp/Fnr family transcriptional regulator [Emticicia sp. BO119]MBA4849543.1 Crp/Fnr family transcriptional regulator [Emticicia sp. BO119]
MQVQQIINQIYTLPEASFAQLKSCIKEVSFPKKYLLLRADTIERKIYFIKTGIVRAYAYQNENEITFWFGKEGETIISMKSYIMNQPGYENIELLETCELYELKTDKLQELFKQDIHIANWGRKFAEQELIKTEERLIARQFSTTAERYSALLKNHPDLLQRISLGYIASYLGVTQVSLSRIRAEIK